MMTPEEIREVYRRRARRYHLTSHAYALVGYRLGAYRRRGVEALALRPGDTVVEIGCGTGANFPAIQQAIGATGRVVGVDLTPAMLDQARAGANRNGWTNVDLVESAAAQFTFPTGVNGIVSTFALTLAPEYDAVIRRGAEALVPGGRFVVVDFKAPPAWPEWTLHAVVPLLRPFGVTLDLRHHHPWESLANHLHLVAMEERYFGTTYIAVGEKRKEAGQSGEPAAPGVRAVAGAPRNLLEGANATIRR
ncbi:MAG: class I SAM-dependent methyltransferase [Gemmatimonadota bacterium]|nr:class I SAM-dependent methyltransferase [Gemmatimonadota bacterium]